MNTSIPQPRPSLAVWSGAILWLSAFFSPTVYLLGVLLAAKCQVNLPQTLALSLFFLIPVVALLICEWVAWSCGKTVGRKLGGMLFTLLAMLIQCAALLVGLRVILVTAIGYAQ